MKTTLHKIIILGAFLACTLLGNAQTYYISTYAGNGYDAGAGGGGFSGDGGQATAAEMYYPYGLAIDGSGNIYVADQSNQRIRKITSAGIITTIAGSTAGYSGNGGQATAAQLQSPYDVAVDGSGNIYISDQGNNVVRKINSSGIITAFAGAGGHGYSGDGGQATAADLFQPVGMAIDASGNVYIADEFNHVIRKVNTSGVISTYAGNGTGHGTPTGGYSGDGGQATAAELNTPQSVVFDAAGNLYIADQGNNRIRKVTPAGVISTFASITSPSRLAINSSGVLFCTDGSVHVRQISTSGAVSNIAGNGSNGYTGDGGPANSAELNETEGIALDASGNVYFADNFNNVIRKLCPVPSTPGAISGTTAVCQSSVQTYSVSPVTYATSYTWTLPSGWSGTSTTNSINATIGSTGGNITVVANGACANSSAQSLTVTVNTLPGISNQPIPLPQTVCENGVAIPMQITATGSGLTYQWYSNTSASNSGGTLLSGATVPAYIPLTTSLGTLYYYCVVSGTCSPSVTSNVSGAVTVVANPVITSQPSTSGQTGCPGFSATALSITATGTGLSYQWYSNTTNSNSGGLLISGATSSSYTPITTTPGAEYYYCTVTNSNSCYTTSNTSGLITVNTLPSISVQPSTSTQTGCSGFSATALSVTASGTSITYQWYKNVANSNSGGTLIAGATSANYTPVTTTAGTLYYYCVVSGACIPSVTSNTSGAVTVNATPSISVQPSSSAQSGCPGFTPTALSITASGTSITYQWYSNTANSNSGGTLLSGATSASYTPVTTVSGTLYYYCTVSGTCSPAATSSVSGAVNVNTLPTISIQPSTSNQTGCLGYSATALSVTASGTGITYQWYSNTTNSNSGGTLISGATSASYTPVTTASGTLYYYCVVSGTCSPSVTSNVSGSVTVNTPPSISVQPSSSAQSGCPGFSPTALSVTASGTNIAYQWYSNTANLNSGGTLISGATSSSYTPVTTASGTLYYYCAISGTCSPIAISNVSGAVTVYGIPAITTNPSTTTQTGCPGFSAATLSVAATGTNLAYQWYSNTTNSNSGGTLLNGATSSSYTPITTTPDTLYYYCVVSGACSPSVTSNTSGAVIVNPGTPATPGVITGITGICPSTTGVTYTIASVANATTYTWAVPTGWTITAGSGTTSITVKSGMAGQNGNITVTAGNSCGTSAASTLGVTVYSSPTVSITGNVAGGFTICSGSVDTLTALVSGGSGSGYTFAWSDGNTNAVEYIVTTGNYTVTVTDGNGCTNSAGQMVTVNSLPTVNVSASANALCVGTSDTLTATNVVLNENGLVAYYPFNGNANDASGNGYNATPNGVQLATDRFGNPASCYYFSGSSTYVQCPNATYFNGDFTISAWVMADTLQSYARLLDFGNGSGNDNVIDILSIASTGDLGFAVYSGSTNSGNMDDGTPLPLGTWGQTVLTLKDKTYCIYYNGILISTGTSNLPPRNITRTINYIGKSNWPGDGGLYGYIDDVRIYNRALSNAEVDTLYNHESVTETSYQWSTGSMNDTAIVTPTGTQTFTVYVTNEDGCVGSATQQINVNALPNVTVTTNPSNGNVCAGGQITLSGNGASTYSWSGGITDNVAFTPVSNATYTVTGTDTNNCVNTATQAVTINPLPTIGVTVNPGNATVCEGSYVTLAGSGAVSYSWSGGITDAIAFAASATNTYTVTGTDANNCSNTATQMITVNPAPTISIVSTPTTATVCFGGQVTLAGSGTSTSYNWSGGITDNTAFTPSATARYTVTGTGSNNCTNTATQVVTVNQLPNITITANPLSGNVCSGEQVTLSGNGASSYSWSGGITNNVAFTPLGNATYTVTGTDSNNCMNTATQMILVTPTPTITITGKDTILLGSNDTLVANGALTYSWNGGNTKDTLIVSPSGQTSYTVTGTNLGCSSSITFTVDVEVTTGIQSIAHGGDLTLYPNPANTYVTISTNNAQLTMNSEAAVYNEAGEVVIPSFIIRNSKFAIDINNLAAGTYFVRVNTGTQSQVVRFIKTK